MEEEKPASTKSEENAQEIKYQRVVPRTITGTCSAKNKYALDWGPCGLVAYGCNFTVVVVDTTYVQTVQTFDRHRAAVTKVKWSPASSLSQLLLASGDANGQIFIWDVKTGNAVHLLQDGNKPISDMFWVSAFDNGEKFLAAVHPPYSLILWDATNGMKIWKKSYTEQLLMMDNDPFNPSKLAFVSQSCILLVDDFNVTKTPSSNGKKFYVTLPKASTPLTPTVSPFGSDKSRDRLKRLVRDIIVGESAPRSTEDSSVSNQNECVQLSFHRSLRDILVLVYPREILLVDLRIHHSVAVIPTSDRGYTPFHQVLLCRQTDSMVCVHESGSLTLRSSSSEVGTEIVYEQKCQTESIRCHKNNKILAASLDPVYESRLAVLLSDGRVFFYEFANQKEVSRLEVGRMTLIGLLPQLSPAPTTVRMCPPITLKNWKNHTPLLAVGCTNGMIQFFNAATGILEKEIAVHNYTVKGIEWTGLHSVLSHAQTLTSSNAHRNEVLLTNVRTGKVTVVRPERGDETPIDVIRVSALKQYFIITFKDAPLELWDLRRLTLLRTLPKKFPAITALEWSPLHIPRVHRKSIVAEDSDASTSALPAITTKEFFVFSDPDSNLYHLTVEGSVVKDCERLANPSLNGIIALTWKHDFMALGDAEGGVALWDWRNRTYRLLPSARSPIRKLRFAPGKHNLKLLVLHMDGVDVWDARESERLGQWRNSPLRDVTSVVDADWSASDCPLFLCSDGAVRVFDVALLKCSSPVAEYADSPASFAFLSSLDQSAIRASIQLNLPTNQEFSGIFPEFPDDFAGKCLQAARLNGDVQQLELWNVAAYYLKYYSRKMENVPELETCYDILCDPDAYRRVCAQRVTLCEAKPQAYEHSRQLARDLLLLGEKDKVIALLLNTESTHEHFYSNHLLACLTAALQTSCHGNAHSTVKLVATHLIASGHVWQGAELLLLNGQSTDACRYLQSNHMWQDAARVAKLLLMTNKDDSATDDGAEIWQRWAHHLSQNKQKFYAVLVLVSVGAWFKAAENLVQMQMNETAALLLRAAQMESLYEPVEEAAKLFTESVYYEYARHLNAIGLNEAAREWAELAGTKGQSLISEWEILKADSPAA